MSAILITVTRKWETGRSIISEFHTTGGYHGMVSGFFMEEKGLSAIKSAQDKRIPAGVVGCLFFTIIKFQSPAEF